MTTNHPFALAALLLAATATRVLADQPNWSQFRGNDAKTAASTAKTTPPLEQKWVAPIGLVNSSPSVVGDTVYVGSYDGHLYAVDADRGHVRWKVAFGKPIYASPVVADGRVFICCTGEKAVSERAKQATCRIACLEAKTGKVVWDHSLIRGDVRYDLGKWAGGWASPVLDASKVYIGSDDRGIYALDRKDGRTVWRFSTAGRVHSAQTLVEDTLYSGCHDGFVYALDRESGKLRWKFKTGSLVNSTVAYRDGAVYFGSYDKHVYAVGAADGKLIWKTPTDPNITSHIVASPTVTADAVFIGTWPGTMYGLDRGTGKVRWRTPLGGRLQASCTVAAGVVFTLAFNRVVGLHTETGKIVWQANLGGAFATSTPTIVDGGLYVGSRSGLHRFVPKPR